MSERRLTALGRHRWPSLFGLVAASTALWLAGSASLKAADPPPAPEGWLETVQRQLEASEYEISWQTRTSLNGIPEAFQAPNRAQGFRTCFVPEGIWIIPRRPSEPSWKLGLRLPGADAANPPLPRVDGAVALFERPGLVLSVENSPRGLLFRWTLSAQEGHGQEARVPLLRRVDGLLPSLASDGRAIDFRAPGGGPAVLRLGELRAADAAGRSLSVRLVGTKGHDSRLFVAFGEAPAWPVTVEALATAASWTGEADQADANFGYGAGTAGDVNGDGYSDVIVGAPGYDNGQSGEGRAYVYYGSASGLATSPAWTAESDMANASFGRVVGTAGDVNGDGFSDVIIGASGYTNGESLEGAAFVYHGGPGGLSATPDWTVEGGQAGAQLGMSAGTAGDVNGDGYSDVLSGAYYYDDGETDEGVVFVFHGSPAGLSTGYAASLQANQAYARFGTSAGTAGDVNGDGYADVIVGADGYDGAFGDDGGAFVFLGSASGLLTPPALSATSGQASAGFGISVGTAGDVNGDGYADVVVGAPNYDLGQSNEGAAFVYLGGSSGPSASPAWTGQADQADARYGFSVSSAGDVNGDTYADLLIGSMYFTNGQFREGRLFVYLGGSGGPAATASWTAESDQNTACLGFPVATAGDVNGDGYADIIAGAMLYDNGQADEGRAYVFHGGPDGLGAASSWSTEGNQANAYWGTSLASAGDVNGDGFDDFLLGSNGFDTAGGANAGKVELFFGSAGGPDATPDWTLEGTQPDGWLGVSAAGAGDVNGDGYADVLIGEAGYSNGQTREGRALLFLGSPSGLGGSPDWAFESNLAYRTMGNPVASAGDVNGDGYADVLLGAPTLWDCHCPGRAYLFHGSPAGLAASPDWTAASDQAEAWFGNSVGSAGDVNGDGFSDVFVAEYAYNGDRGRVFVWYGSTSGLGDAGTPANFDWSAASDGESERFGWRAAGAGDVNGDGYSDLLVGAPNHSSGQIHEGRVCLFQGSASGLAATPSWAAESDQADAQFGYGLSGGGDWNGDGFSDFAAGALAFDGSAGANCGKAWAFYGSVTGPSTPSATTWEGIQAGEFFGLAASSAGDVDGDGRADLLICAQGYDNGESDEGRVAFFYGGGGGGGLALTPGQRRLDDSAPIGPLGLSDDRDGFRIAALGRSPFGRGNLRLQTEVKPFGAAFDGTGLQVSAWADSSLSGAALQNAITGLDDAGGYHWRARLLFDPVTLPYQGSGRWFSPPINGWPEMDLRLHAEADLRIASFTDSPDPVNNLQDLTYGLTIENDGPDEAEGAIVSLVLAPAGVSVAFVPGSSDARWAWDAGTMTLTADLGTLADGVSTSLDAVFTVSGTGSLEADASVSSSTTDPDSGNDSASATTTVSPIADLAITAFTDAPDPVPENTTLTYTLSLSNGGPDTSSATVTETFSPVGTTLTFLPGSSDPRWSWDAGTLTLTASVGAMASGATDSLSAAFTVGPPGTAAAHAEVSGSVFDPSAANNSADASTTICDPTPGAFTVLHPPDASASLSTSAAFYWTPSDGATSYDLRLGTTSPPPLHTSGLTATETSVEGLTPGATYYWDVEARTPCGAVLSSDGPRSFTTGCLTRVGRWPEKPYGMVRSSVVYGAYAYYGNGLYLTVLEVSDPAHPSVVRELPLPAPVDEGELLVAEGYLFAPLTNGTLTIYDLADPETPSEVSTLGGFAGLRGGMEFYGGLLYAADQTSGLRVVSLSPLTSPSIIGTLATSHARDLTLYEKAFTKYAYVVDAYDGLVVMNVTNPAVPVLLTAVDLGDWPESVARSGEYLYVADATNGMRVFSLANPALPVEVGSYVTPNYTEWVVLSGATAFLCDGPGGIKALDVTIPSAPALLGQIDTPGVAMHVWLDGSRAFVGDDFGGLRILDVSAPAAMGELGYRDDSEESTLSLHTNGSLAYVARYSEGLAVMDVSDPSAPVQLGLWSRPGGSLRSVTVSGNTAFVSERYGGLHLVDVSTSATPVLLGSYTDRFGFSCAVSGTLAYFCANTYGLVVLDVSDPADPHEVFRLDTPGGARMVALDAGRAYLADANGGLRILDLSDPVHPTPLGSLSFPSDAVAVAVSGTHAYVAAGAAGLRVVDVSDPAAPVEVGAYDTPGNAMNVEVSGSTAFVSDYGTGVLLLDVSDPAAPTLSGTLNTPGNAWQAHLMGDSLYVADDFGFVIEDLSSCCAGPPGAFDLEYPAPGSTNAPCSATFEWENAPGALSYDVYVDTVDPPLNLVEAGLTSSRWQAEGFPPATTFYWRVEAKNLCGTTSASGSFTTAPIPGSFDLLFPGPDGTNLTTTRMLVWGPSAGAQSYSLYFGTADPPPLRASGVSENYYTVTGLSPGTTYYWYVEALSPCGSTLSTGGTRTFTTGCATLTGRWPSKQYGMLGSSVTYGNYAYAGNGFFLTVLDISNPSSPSVVREKVLTGSTLDENEMLVANGYLYVPQWSNLTIYSLSDPSNPTEVARLPVTGSLYGSMELAGNFLYAAAWTSGTMIFDVSSPSAPVHVGSLPAPLFSGNPDMAKDVTVYSAGPSTYAYVAYLYTGVQVLDVTNPNFPTELAILPLANQTESVGLVGNSLVAGGGDGVTLYDLTNPAAPTVITTWLPSITEAFYVEWVTLSGSMAYVCDSYLGLKVLDLSNPNNPVLLGSRAPRGNPFHLALSGTLGLLAEDFAGLTLLDMSDPSSITQLGFWDASEGESRALWSDGTHVFVARLREGLGILDVSAPASPTEVGAWNLSNSFIYGVTVRDTLAFVADASSNLYILDVTTPSTPSPVGTYAKNGLRTTLSEDGRTLYYATGAGGLHILDVSTPSSPALLGKWIHPVPCDGCSVRAVALDGPYAYLADRTGGLRVIDVSSPEAPVLIASVPTTGSAFSVVYAEGYAFVLSAAALDVFDVSNPAVPTMVSSLVVPENAGILDLSGSVLAVSLGRTEVPLIDVSNPLAPAVLTTVKTQQGAQEARIVGDSLYAADLLGVVIDDLASCCSTPPTSPNLLTPGNDTTEVPNSLKLDWSDPQWALRYDLYLDTVNPPVTMVNSGIKASSKAMALVSGTTYYWKVVAHNPCGTSESPVFSFTTALPDLSLQLSDSPEPVLTTRPVTYTFELANETAGGATAVSLDTTLATTGSASLTFDAGASDPRWTEGAPGELHASLGDFGGGATTSLIAVFQTSGVGTASVSAAVSLAEGDPDLSDNAATQVTAVEPIAIGNQVWRDDDADGVRDAGEPGLPGIVVKLYNDSYQWLQEVVTDPDGLYRFNGLAYGSTYFVKFFLPSPDYAFSPKDQGADDGYDSDADTTTGQTDFITLTSGEDCTRWDCGMVDGALCDPPDETVFIYSVTLTTDGNDYPILNFMDPNQADQVTGYNIYRTHDVALAHNQWTRVASDVVDMDEATANKQWIDTSGEDPPPGYTVWYYEVAAYNHLCPAEGPW